MGKYSLAFLKALLEHKDNNYDEVHILFTANMPLKPAAKKAVTEAAPGAKFEYIDLKVPSDPCRADINRLESENQNVINKTVNEIAPGSQADFLILSLFLDQVCAVFPSTGARRVLLFYDLIPLQYNERYGKLCTFSKYLKSYKTIFEADAILTISQTVADDIALNLGISAAKTHNINGAPIERADTVAKKPSAKLPDRFVLMPSGNDLRKNNQRAIQAFEIFRRDNNSDIGLLVTSEFDDDTRAALEAYSDKVVFTGNVSEEELRWLYEKSEALLFVSEYEGLGLPILEGVEAGKPIVCSNLTVFNEMSGTAFYYADPFDPVGIAGQLAKAVDKTGFAAKHAEYADIMHRYSWENTAASALRVLTAPLKPAEPIKKLRLAVLAPTPAGYSAIGKLVMQLHPAMSQYFDIDYYLEEGKTDQNFSRPNYLKYIANTRPAAEFNRKAYAEYDAVLYHIGNSEFHLDTIKSALYLPGYAIFHDIDLAGVFETVLAPQGYITEDRLAAEKSIDKKIGNRKSRYISSLANNQLGLVAHSAYTENVLRRSLVKSEHDPATLTLRTNLPTATPERRAQRLQGESLTIGLAGIIHPVKGLDIIEAIAQSDDFYSCRIHVFGLSLVGPEVIRHLENYPNVVVDTNVSDFQFQNMLKQVDILINFRPEYRGETSLATIEAMRFGVIPFVKKIGWYDELPDDAVVKVEDKQALLAGLKDLVLDPERQARLKAAGRDYVAKNFNYQTYAEDLYNFISGDADSNNRRGASRAGRIAEAIKDGASPRKLKQLLQDS
jgi:glycosyltransferase involved in cell wall biosynthesis